MDGDLGSVDAANERALHLGPVGSHVLDESGKTCTLLLMIEIVL